MNKEKINFKSNEEKLLHIGLACATNLHDAFSNMGIIISLASAKDGLDDKTRFRLIKEKAQATYELFRTIERYRNQSEKAEVKTFSVGELCEKVVKSFGRENCELNIISDIKVTVKRTLLAQAIINLVDNALTHNKLSYPDKKVCITVNKNEIIVSDNGAGVPDEIKDKIFDLFFTTKDLDKLNGEHNGIGLYGVKQHMDTLGWTITVENNTILSGANFKISIP